MPIKPFEIFQRELHITASFVNPHTTDRAVELLAHGRVKVEPLISRAVPLEELTEVLTDPKYRRLAKILVKP